MNVSAEREIELMTPEQFEQPLLAEEPVTHPQDRMVFDHRIVRDEDARPLPRRAALPHDVLRVARIDESPRTEQIRRAAAVEQQELHPGVFADDRQVAEPVIPPGEIFDHLIDRLHALRPLHIAVVIPRQVDQRNRRIPQRAQNRPHQLELPRLAGAGQVAGADRHIFDKAEHNPADNSKK